MVSRMACSAAVLAWGGGVGGWGGWGGGQAGVCVCGGGGGSKWCAKGSGGRGGEDVTQQLHASPTLTQKQRGSVEVCGGRAIEGQSIRELAAAACLWQHSH